MKVFSRTLRVIVMVVSISNGCIPAQDYPWIREQWDEARDGMERRLRGLSLEYEDVVLDGQGVATSFLTRLDYGGVDAWRIDTTASHSGYRDNRVQHGISNGVSWRAEREVLVLRSAHAKKAVHDVLNGPLFTLGYFLYGGLHYSRLGEHPQAISVEPSSAPSHVANVTVLDLVSAKMGKARVTIGAHGALGNSIIELAFPSGHMQWPGQ
ncbi:MAG: hypothetical protein ACI85K_002098, partial [Hyphomicrobiaceae bacterium]